MRSRRRNAQNLRRKFFTTAFCSLGPACVAIRECGLTPSDEWVNEIANNAVTGALVGRTRGYNGEGNAAPRRRSSIDAGLARPSQLGESLSQLVQAADDADGVPY